MSAPYPAAALMAVAGAEAAAAVRRAGRVNALLGMDVGAGSAGGADGLPADRLRPGDDAVAGWVDAVAGWLGTRQRRVAASMVVLGYAARLVGPSVAVLLRDGILIDVRRSRVRCSYAAQRGFRLSWTEPGGWRGAPAALRERWCRDMVTDHLGSLIAAVRAVEPVATGLLWGNVASGVAGTLQTLAAGGWVTPDRCLAEGLSILDSGPLRRSGTLRADDGALSFVRRSCCLYYRLDGGGVCGDCPLLARGGAP